MNHGKEVKIDEITLERQCDPEYLEQLRKIVDQYDIVLSLACGVGVQFLGEKYMTTPVLRGVDTCFMGVTESDFVSELTDAKEIQTKPSRCGCERNV